ncbi:MAG: hypothetical protein CM15mP45_10430 [Deltaproteobacteria bacterium]|nr:MAG: hypothetical protein CM15mP45_10430 [Deltaproteobacteria bacterium]
MNNQIILPPNHYIFIKINKINKINKLKIIINLKYTWKALISWYLFRREKNKPIWVQFRAQLIFKKIKKLKKSVDNIFNIN